MNDQTQTPRFVVTDDTAFDTTSNLTWTRADAIDDDVTYEEAEKAIAALNEKAFGGFTDWRFPTVDELFALADRTKYDPAIDTEVFSTCKSDWYWTSTLHAKFASLACFVYFYYGLAYYDYRDNNYRVRAVRGPSRQ